jgi:predicted murein hydrolase (TIGR00659 family)
MGSFDFIPWLWLALTLVVYFGARAVYSVFPRWWTSPMLVTWAVCSGALIGFHASYHEYVRGTNWLMVVLGPATVAFALPIYEQRELIRRNWRILTFGIVAGCLISILSAWVIAWALALTPAQEASLFPRSITMPFAVAASKNLGGIPELTALLVAFSGLFGASVGEALLNFLPLRTVFARGAMFGMGAHGLGVAKACQIGREEGAVAGVIMIFAGIMNVAGATVVMMWK